MILLALVKIFLENDLLIFDFISKFFQRNLKKSDVRVFFFFSFLSLSCFFCVKTLLFYSHQNYFSVKWAVCAVRSDRRTHQGTIQCEENWRERWDENKRSNCYWWKWEAAKPITSDRILERRLGTSASWKNYISLQTEISNKGMSR